MSCDYPCPGDAGSFHARCEGSGQNGTWHIGPCTALPPPPGGPGLVVCGATACDLDAGQGCCDTINNDASTHQCGPLAAGSFCLTGATQECDDKDDCKNAEVCCLLFLPQGIQASCMPSCITGAPRYQACSTAAECENGAPCASHACPAGETVRTCEKPLSCQ
jgi:hypothetical protein